MYCLRTRKRAKIANQDGDFLVEGDSFIDEDLVNELLTLCGFTDGELDRVNKLWPLKIDGKVLYPSHNPLTSIVLSKRDLLSLTLQYCLAHSMRGEKVTFTTAKDYCLRLEGHAEVDNRAACEFCHKKVVVMRNLLKDCKYNPDGKKYDPSLNNDADVSDTGDSKKGKKGKVL
ncbi:hypothetical protein JCM10213v2_008894 [Rhodosporidiobolus nylandii]